MKKLGLMKLYKATIDLSLIAYYITSETYTRSLFFKKNLNYFKIFYFKNHRYIEF